MPISSSWGFQALMRYTCIIYEQSISVSEQKKYSPYILYKRIYPGFQRFIIHSQYIAPYNRGSNCILGTNESLFSLKFIAFL